ncbi:MAG: hypothetical protein VX447_13040 [Pseudomonadota bacterium]|uniref:hypothetical protein n=1 Tax=Gallaecimonas pentaromativorans TaxID=584787 RepID=UPI00067F67DB|nr:hypothetical protein [Gallaecimonas pentaromativorans]MED5525662.1 hypothetical protein [Pseudomonadota bacterium]
MAQQDTVELVDIFGDRYALVRAGSVSHRLLFGQSFTFIDPPERFLNRLAGEDHAVLASLLQLVDSLGTFGISPYTAKKRLVDALEAGEIKVYLLESDHWLQDAGGVPSQSSPPPELSREAPRSQQTGSRHAKAAAPSVKKAEAAIATDPGITGGKVARLEFMGAPATKSELDATEANNQREDSYSLKQQEQLMTNGAARTTREMLLAIESGHIPRYLVRVGPKKNFAHGTFANPNNEFAFAAEPADLRGLSAEEAMRKVGWTDEWIENCKGEEIVACIVDTHSSEEFQEVASLEWEDLHLQVINDRATLLKMAGEGISRDELDRLFSVAKETPVGAQPAGLDKAQVEKYKAFRDVLEQRFSANELYTGFGATMTEGGSLGAREVMLVNKGGRRGFQLGSVEHKIVSLGEI